MYACILTATDAILQLYLQHEQNAALKLVMQCVQHVCSVASAVCNEILAQFYESCLFITLVNIAILHSYA